MRLLPASLMPYFDEEDVLAQSGCDRETVQKRRKELEAGEI